MNDDQGNSDMAESSAVGSRVLAFYEELPFNYRETVESSASAIRSQNSVAHYSVLPPLLLENTRVLELGCGTGWLSNGISFHYGCQVTGIDFNPVAIERAEEVASALHLDSVWFQQADLFEFRGEAPYDLVVSMGVLHHTADCHGAIRRACNDFVRIGGHVMIGLYHAYGRRPFLDHFAQMRKDGAGEEEMLDRFRRLHGQLTDDTLVVSWFRDQVWPPTRNPTHLERGTAHPPRLRYGAGLHVHQPFRRD